MSGSLLEAMTVFRSIYGGNVSKISASAMTGYLSANGLTAADWSTLTSAADGV